MRWLLNLFSPKKKTPANGQAVIIYLNGSDPKETYKDYDVASLGQPRSLLDSSFITGIELVAGGGMTQI